MPRRKPKANPQAGLAAYLRVSTRERGDKGHGLDAQRRSIEAARESKVTHWFQDVASGRSRNGRHGLEQAIKACESGECSGIVAAKADRLSRSIVDFAGLLDWATRGG